MKSILKQVIVKGWQRRWFYQCRTQDGWRNEYIWGCLTNSPTFSLNLHSSAIWRMKHWWLLATHFAGPPPSAVNLLRLGNFQILPWVAGCGLGKNTRWQDYRAKNSRKKSWVAGLLRKKTGEKREWAIVKKACHVQFVQRNCSCCSCCMQDRQPNGLPMLPQPYQYLHPRVVNVVQHCKSSNYLLQPSLACVCVLLTYHLGDCVCTSRELFLAAMLHCMHWQHRSHLIWQITPSPRWDTP